MIEISVLNSSLERIAIIDYYSSFIWTDRYNDAGEFELCLPITALKKTCISPYLLQIGL